MARRIVSTVLAATLAIAAAACSGDDDASSDTPVTRTAGSTATTDVDATTPDGTDPTGSTDGSTPSPPATSETNEGSTLDVTVPVDEMPTSTTSGATTTSTVDASTTTVALDPSRLPDVDAKAYFVYDMRARRTMAQSNAAERLPVGSLIKLLTTHVAYGAGQTTKLVTAPAEPLLIETDESQIGISPGQELPRDLLVRAMLKASANDAARLLALDIAGSEAAYAELMNQAAAQLGLTNTHAVNVTGLDAEGQFSSAADITKLGVTLMGNISFQQTVKDPTAELNGQAIPNANTLLTTYPGADGIKTGRTSGAGWCILASATRNNRRIVVAVLGAPDQDARNAAASALLDWAFLQP